MKFKTKDWDADHCKIERSTYPDGSPKLTVRDRYGQVVCCPTVCLSDMNEYPQPGHAFIREWGDTQGSLRTLQDAGVIGRTHRIIEVGTHTRDPLLRRPAHEVPLQ